MKQDEMKKIIENALYDWEKWRDIVYLDYWEDHGKTKKQAMDLESYFEGQYDMAIMIRNKLSDNK